MKSKLIVLVCLCVVLFSCKSKRMVRGNYVKDSLAFELCQIYGLDQGIRNPKLIFNDLQLSQKVDTLNFLKIVEFVEKNGYPRKELLGEKNMKNECVSGSAFTVLLHNPHRLVIENKYFDLFLNEVKKGNIKPDFFATILDKYYWTKSKNKETRRVFYGSQFGKPCIQTKEATNKARLEIGLKSLKDTDFLDCAGEQLDMPKIRK
jgi:hypothetical protein